MTNINTIWYDLKYCAYMLVLYFYTWFKYAMSYAPRTQTTVDIYVWNTMTMTMMMMRQQQQAQNEEEHLLFYVLCGDESILVFRDAQRMRQVVALLQKEGAAAVLRRRPFRYFLEAEIVGGEGEGEDNVLPLLTRYDNGHGEFFQDLTGFALTPAHLYDFAQQRLVLQNHGSSSSSIRVTPLNSMESHLVAPGQKLGL
jgi:hypothetical protein